MARVLGVACGGRRPARDGHRRRPAVRRLLERTRCALEDFDLVEVNEAFAAQVLACDRELRFDPERLNVNGGAIALGPSDRRDRGAHRGHASCTRWPGARGASAAWPLSASAAAWAWPLAFEAV